MSEHQQNGPPSGELFSRVYLERGENLADSARFRTRLAAHFDRYLPPISRLNERARVSVAIRMQLGVEVLNFGEGPVFGEFFRTAPIRDVLDTITIVYRHILEQQPGIKAREWREDAAKIFSEEGLLYSVDDRGGVHRAVDSEFDHNRAVAIRALSSSRYGAVRDALDRAYDKLAQHDRDGKGAVRDCFEAAETLAKLLCDTNAGLDAGFVKDRIAPLAQSIYSGDPATVSTAGRMVSSFADWVQAAHPFRHGQRTEVPTELPDDLAVLLISQGASFIRWLADLDGQARKT